MTNPPQPLSIDAVRLFNRRVNGAPPGVRELVLCVEFGGVRYEVATAMQGSPCIDDWIAADGIRELIAGGCPREAVAP